MSTEYNSFFSAFFGEAAKGCTRERLNEIQDTIYRVAGSGLTADWFKNAHNREAIVLREVSPEVKANLLKAFDSIATAKILAVDDGEWSITIGEPVFAS